MEICIEENIPIKGYRILEFSNFQEAKQWVVDNQLARRNLTPDQIKYYSGNEYLNTKQPAGNPQFRQVDGIGQNTGNVSDKDSGKSPAEVLADTYNVSPRTIERNAEFAEQINALPPKEKATAIAGLARKRCQSDHQPKFDRKKCEAAIDFLHRQIKLFSAERETICGHVIQALTEFGVFLKGWFSDHLPKIQGKFSNGKCRDCGADIVWAVTEQGKNMMFDAEPPKKAYRTTYVIRDGIASTGDGQPRYVSHFVTCKARKK